MKRRKIIINTTSHLQLNKPLPSSLALPYSSSAGSSLATRAYPLGFAKQERGTTVQREIMSKSLYHLASDKAIELKNINSSYKQAKKGLVGLRSGGRSPVLSTDTILHYNTKSVVYSFNKVNNLYPLLTKTEYLLKCLFRSMYSLISKPVYLLKHDKIIIRLFVFLSPKLDKYLDTSTRRLSDFIQSSNASALARRGGWSLPNIKNIIKYAAQMHKRGAIKNLRPQTVEILKSQIKSNPGPGLQPGYGLYGIYQAVARALSVDLNKSEATNNKQFANASPSSWLSNDQNNAKATYLPISVRLSTKVRPELCLAELTYPSELAPYTKATDAKGELESAYRNKSNGLAYPNTSLVSNFKDTLEKLSIIFGKLFNKKVEFEIIKAQLPFQDSHILAQILGYNANKYKFRRMLKILIPRAVIKNPSKQLSEKAPYVVPVALRTKQWDGLWSSAASHRAKNLTALEANEQVSRTTHSRVQSADRLVRMQVCEAFSRPLTLAQAQGKDTQTSYNPIEMLYSKSTGDDNSLGAKNLKMLISQPSSYLPPYFYSKYNISLPLWLSNKWLKKEFMSTVDQTTNIINPGPSNIKYPSYLSGMNIKLAGRLMTQSIRPRFTVQSLQEGSLARVKVHFIEKSRFTGKNKRGAFSFTITISHVFN